MEFEQLTPEEAQIELQNESFATALNTLHRVVNAMGSMAGEGDPARRTAEVITDAIAPSTTAANRGAPPNDGTDE